MGLYQDDGLAILLNTSGPKFERIRKDILKAFQQYSLQVTSSGKFWSYRKLSNQPLFIHASPNHSLIMKIYNKK